MTGRPDSRDSVMVGASAAIVDCVSRVMIQVFYFINAGMSFLR